MFSAFLKPALSGMYVAHTYARGKTQLQFIQFACIRSTDPEFAFINKHAARSVMYREIRLWSQSIWARPRR